MKPLPERDRGHEQVTGQRDKFSDLHARGIRAGVWVTVNAIGSGVLALVNFVLLSRILGPESFGLMAMVDATLALGQSVLATALAEPLIQIRRLRSGHADTLFWTLQVVGAVLVLAMIVSGGAVERYFVQDGLAELVTAASFILYLRATEAVPRALLARGLRFAATAQATLSAEAAGGVLGLYLALTGHGVWSLVFMRLAAALIEMLMLWWKAAWIPTARWSLTRFHELWRFSASRGLSGLLLFVNQQVPRIILGRVVGAPELGRFVFARQIIRMSGTVLTNPIRTVAMPTFAQLQADYGEARRLHCEGTRLTASVLFPLRAGTALVAPILVPLVVGRSWIQAVPLVQLFALNAYREPFNTWNSALLRGLGKPEWLLATMIWRTAATLLLIVLLLPGGSIGVCLAILAGTYLSWPVAIRFVSRLTGLGTGMQLRQGAPALGATLIMAAALVAIRQPVEMYLSPWAAAVTIVSAGVGVYVAGLALVGRVELMSLAKLPGNIRSIFRRSSHLAPGEPDDSSSDVTE